MPVPRSVPTQSLSSTTLVKKCDRKLGMESTVKDSIHQKTSTVKDSIRQKRNRVLPHGLVTSDHVAQGQGSPAAARVRDGAASCAPQTVSGTRCNADSGSTTLRFLSFTQGRNFGQDDKALRRGEGFNGIFVCLSGFALLT